MANSVANTPNGKEEENVMFMQAYAPELEMEITEIELKFKTGSLANLTIQPTMFSNMRNKPRIPS